MASVEFVSQSTRDADNMAAQTQRLLNCYAEPLVDGAKATFAIKPTLGMSEFSTTSGVFLREMAEVNGTLYAVTDGTLYEVSTGGTATSIGTLPNAVDTVITSVYGQAAITAGGSYYVYDGTLNSVDPAAFTYASSVCFVGGRAVITEQGSRFTWSEAGDPQTVAGHFAVPEQIDDDIVRGMALNGNLWLFGGKSIEVWYATGGLEAEAFAPVSGAVHEIGLRAFGLATQTQDALFFVGSDGIAYLTAGGTPQPVSTPSVETAIKTSEPTHAIYYEDEGHKMCGIRFSDRPAWFYDLSTGLWHERGSDEEGAWRCVTSTKFNGSWVAGGDGGTIYSLERTAYDGDQHMERQLISSTLYMDGSRFRINALEFLAKVGRTTPTTGTRGANAEPVFLLDVSRDGGMTWDSERTVSLGGLGNMMKRLIARRFGQFRQATLRIRMTDNTDVAFLSKVNVT